MAVSMQKTEGRVLLALPRTALPLTDTRTGRMTAKLLEGASQRCKRQQCETLASALRTVTSSEQVDKVGPRNLIENPRDCVDPGGGVQCREVPLAPDAAQYQGTQPYMIKERLSNDYGIKPAVSQQWVSHLRISARVGLQQPLL